MVNLLYIIEGGKPGGAEQLLLTVIKAINKTQYRVVVCLLKPADILEDELKKINIPVYVLNMSGKLDIFSFFKLVQFMRREKIDIVHTGLYTSNAIGRIAAILAHIPVIIAWEHGEILRQQPFRHYKIDNILSKFTDIILTGCNACKEDIIKKERIPSSKIRVIYNCVDLDKFSALSEISTIRRQLGINSDEILIGTVATLINRVKGQEYIIRAMPQIIRVYPKAKLLLVGRDGSSKSYFVQIAKSLNIIDRVILTGFRADMLEIMKALDIYVSPSLSEAFSISILEAMSLKKPVVATNVGGTSELVIENQTGYLVPPKDADSIAQAVIDLLSDREKMRRMGEAGFERVKTYFSSDLIIKEIETLYTELLWKNHPKSQ